MRQLSISMPSYIGTALKRFGHLITHGAASPAVYTPPHYGSTKPQPATVDDSEPLSPADAKVLQEIVGVFLYYARAVDVSMLPAVTAVASEQAKPTQAVFAAANVSGVIAAPASCRPRSRSPPVSTPAAPER